MRPHKRAEICFSLPATALTKPGIIDIPFVGKVDVLGRHWNEAQKAVNLKVQNSSAITIFRSSSGEFAFRHLENSIAPGKHVVMQNQVTIFEAIALGGDLSLWPTDRMSK